MKLFNFLWLIVGAPICFIVVLASAMVVIAGVTVLASMVLGLVAITVFSFAPIAVTFAQLAGAGMFLGMYLYFGVCLMFLFVDGFKYVKKSYVEVYK